MIKALFLDRDGVVNHDIGYASQPEQIEFMPGIFELCKQAIDNQYKIIIVTNQSGIARGYYSEQDFKALSLWMCEQFAAHNIKIEAIFHCPHHPALTGTCACRKPEPGMILSAIEQFAIDATHSVMIGDNVSDMLAASRAGIATRLLITDQAIEQSSATAQINSLEQAIAYLI